MTDHNPKSLQTTVTALNATMLSQHLASLMRKEGVTPAPESLILSELMQWSAQHHYLNPIVGEMEAGAVAGAANEHPEETYNNLADNRMLEATTLDEAAAVLSSVLTELLGQ